MDLLDEGLEGELVRSEGVPEVDVVGEFLVENTDDRVLKVGYDVSVCKAVQLEECNWVRGGREGVDWEADECRVKPNPEGSDGLRQLSTEISLVTLGGGGSRGRGGVGLSLSISLVEIRDEQRAEQVVGNGGQGVLVKGEFLLANSNKDFDDLLTVIDITWKEVRFFFDRV